MQRHGWHEYGNYIGLGSAIALVCRSDRGAVRALTRRSLVRRLAGADDGRAVPAVARRVQPLCARRACRTHLPLFSSFRIPSRYTIPFLQFAALTLAWAFQSAVVRYGFPQIGTHRGRRRVSRRIRALDLRQPVELEERLHRAAFDTTFHWMSGPRQIATDADEQSPTRRARRCCAR